MSKEPNNIDRLVREKLDGFEMTPPPSVWESTSASLNAGRRKRFLLWFTLGLAFLAILGTSIYFFSDRGNNQDQLIAQTGIDQTNGSNQDRSGTKNTENSNGSSNSTKTPSSTQENASNEDTETDEDPLTDSFGNVEPATDHQHSASAKKSSTPSKNDIREDATLEQNTMKGQDQSATTGDRTIADASTQDSQGDANDQLAMTGDQNLPSETNIDSDRINESDTPNGSTDIADKVLEDINENRDLTSSESNIKKNFISITTHPARVLDFEEPFIAENRFEEDTIPTPVPLWKSISVEGAIGVSTFRNQPKKSTVPNLSEAINNAASGQQSIDVRFGVNYHFTNRFSFQSGIHYNSMKENYAYDSEEIVTYTNIDTISYTVDSMTFDTTWITNTTTYDTSIISSEIAQNTYRILHLPFQFAWSQPVSTRGILEFSVGGALSILGRNTGSVIVDNSNYVVDVQSAYHTTGMLSIGGSVKYIHRFGTHHSIYAEPWAQFGVTNQSAPPLSYESLRRRYGIRVGYRFYF